MRRTIINIDFLGQVIKDRWRTALGSSSAVKVYRFQENEMSAITRMPPVDESRREAVSFATAHGITLVGHLYPARSGAGGPTAALVMCGPMTSVKEETLPHYAAALQDAGYSVLTFDNRNFGESGGMPRQHLDTYEQVEDLRNAVSYMLSRDDVDPERLGLCCVCLGAGYGLEVAVLDRRVKAVALVGGGYNLTDTYLEFLGHEGFEGFVEQLNGSRQLQFQTAEVQYMPAVAGPPDFGPAAMPVEEAFEYYSSAQVREAPNWENWLTVESMEHIIGWNVIGHAHLVTQPLLVVHGTTDQLLPPRYAQQVYDQAPEPKQLEWIRTDNHVQIYDQEPYALAAIGHVIDFLSRHLPARTATASLT